MTAGLPEGLFRKAAGAEGGMPVSAGARAFHIDQALEARRLVEVDLSGLPEGDRPAVIAGIKERVARAIAKVKEEG